MNPDPRIGTTLAAKYELVRRLGAGGMGVVYEAVNGLTGRRVAVKLLIGDAVSAHVRERLFREARAAARIQHPNVVDVLDVAIDPDAGPFLVMELLDGESLEDRLLREGPLAFEEVGSLLQPVAEALQVAHEAGIVHRDIKPSNIFLHTGSRGELMPKLVDFGIAIADGPRLTRSGVMAGTVGYMAPEQMQDAKRADARADIWSFGVVVYECFAGKSPFEGATAVEVMSSVLSGRLLPLDQAAPAAPGSVVGAVHRALTLDASVRPKSILDFMRLAGFDGVRRDSDVAAAAALPAIVLTPPTSTLPLSGVPVLAVPTRVGGRKVAVAGIAAIVGAAALVGTAALVIGRTWRPTETQHAPSAPAAAAVHFGPRLALPSLESRTIAAGTASLGSTLEEVRAARDECSSETGAADCSERRFDVELPPRTEPVAAFALGKSEVSVEQLRAWLTTHAGLRVQGDGSMDWLADAEGPLAALANQVAPEAGLSLGKDGIEIRPSFANRPAVWVTQRASALFCRAVGGRLPTSSEWEWAARGEARRRYTWGNAFFGCHRAVAARASGKTCGAESDAAGPVAVFEQRQDVTPEGLLGLAGNVAEWVADPAPARWTHQSGACEHGGCFVVRGGDWASDAVATRAAARRYLDRDRGTGWIGFRCAFDQTSLH